MNPPYTGPIKTHADARCLARKLQAIHEASGRKHSEHLDAAAMLLWSWQYVAERPSVGERIARLANVAGPDAHERGARFVGNWNVGMEVDIENAGE